MYVNIKNLFTINPLLLPILLVLRHASKEDVSEKIAMLITSDKDLEYLEENSYIKYIKGKKEDNQFQRMRLDKKGTEYLNSLEEADVTDEDVTIFNWLSDIYKSKDKQIGNGKKTKRLIASFREKSGIEKNNLAYLCNTFINDDEEQEWSFKLEYVFFKPANAYQTRFTLEQSRLYQYYIKKKNFFDSKFKNL